jgi:hypothetical protein
MFVLAQGGGGPKSSWVACIVDVTNGMLAKPAEQKTTTSPCFAINESTFVCSAAQKAVLPCEQARPLRRPGEAGLMAG